jgi:peptide-methionine (R)-S-oxide reductase
MKNLNIFILILLFAVSCKGQEKVKEAKLDSTDKKSNMQFEIKKSDEEWKNTLSPEEFRVMRQKGTERPFSGEYELFSEDGYYKCRACGNKLFKSDTKFDAHCGWPSFYDVENTSAVKLITDTTLGMLRTEVVCAKCGGHLGHVFEDGPNPTGLRYCINSVSIKFTKKEKEEDGKTK